VTFVEKPQIKIISFHEFNVTLDRTKLCRVL